MDDDDGDTVVVVVVVVAGVISTTSEEFCMVGSSVGNPVVNGVASEIDAVGTTVGGTDEDGRCSSRLPEGDLVSHTNPPIPTDTIHTTTTSKAQLGV